MYSNAIRAFLAAKSRAESEPPGVELERFTPGRSSRLQPSQSDAVFGLDCSHLASVGYVSASHSPHTPLTHPSFAHPCDVYRKLTTSRVSGPKTRRPSENNKSSADAHAASPWLTVMHTTPHASSLSDVFTGPRTSTHPPELAWPGWSSTNHESGASRIPVW